MRTKKRKLKMTNCRAPGCSHRSANNKNISFHWISAKKEEIKKKWLHNLNRKFIPETQKRCLYFLNILTCLVLNVIYKQSWWVQSQETYWKMMQFQPFLNTLRALLEKEFLHLREKISKPRNSSRSIRSLWKNNHSNSARS